MNFVQAVLAFQRRAVSFTKTTPVNRPPGGVHELDVPGNPVLHSVLLILLVYTGHKTTFQWVALTPSGAPGRRAPLTLCCKYGQARMQSDRCCCVSIKAPNTNSNELGGGSRHVIIRWCHVVSEDTVSTLEPCYGGRACIFEPKTLSLHAHLPEVQRQ